MRPESSQDVARRRYQRTLFNSVAQLYDASRLRYPLEVVEFVINTAGLSAGSSVLEVGCGTGQLTEDLILLGFDVTAIDIGPSMIATAERRLGGSTASFQVSSFEDFAHGEASFDLVISGTAFHWVDPEIKFHKSARLLRSGGWLALLDTGERYDDPFGAALLDIWISHSDDGGEWAKKRRLSDTEILTDTGLFEQPIPRTHEQSIVLSASAVIDVESTRATFLSWPDELRRGFMEDLRSYLRSNTYVSLIQSTSLTMARVTSSRGLSEVRSTLA
jgi:ubiquinone/menaquinone biosynthesis C-methylase UbiE